MLVTNIDTGPRGIWLADGTLAMLDPGEARDLDIADGETPGSWFTFSGSQKPVVSEANDDELRDAVEAKTGNRPHHKTGRAKLLEMLAD